MPVNRPSPDAILAHVRLLRLTDRLLDVADELRDARENLRTLLGSSPGAAGDDRTEGPGNE